MSKIGQNLNKMYTSIKGRIPFAPKVGIVLGSGLGGILDKLDIKGVIPYKDIEGFPQSTAPDHKGQFLFAYINDVPVVIMQGRVHYYEGYSIDEVVYPSRLMALMGVKLVILTNAAGGMYDGMEVGDIMMIKDHISTFVPSPLRGENLSEYGVRFPDMGDVYSKKLRDKAKVVAKKIGLDLKEGIYVQLSGPQFETPAEIQFYKSMGWGACGMSTAVEAIALGHMGVKVLGFSMITNYAAGLKDEKLEGTDVVDVANKRGKVFSDYILRLVDDIKNDV